MTTEFSFYNYRYVVTEGDHKDVLFVHSFNYAVPPYSKIYIDNADSLEYIDVLAAAFTENPRILHNKFNGIRNRIKLSQDENLHVINTCFTNNEFANGVSIPGYCLDDEKTKVASLSFRKICLEHYFKQQIQLAFLDDLFEYVTEKQNEIVECNDSIYAEFTDIS